MRRAISPSSRTSGDVHCTSASTVCVERKLTMPRTVKTIAALVSSPTLRAETLPTDG